MRSDQVVVVMGASSAIGRETALRFARQGARLVLADPDTTSLLDLAGELEAVIVPCDVADYDQVCTVGRRGIEEFGRIDVWVNNASATAHGTVERMEPDEIRRVIDVNFLATVHGMKAALPLLREQGGTIVNVTSILGKRAVPLQAAYCAAKHGVVAFTEALRMELRREGLPIEIVDVRPAGIDKPFSEPGVVAETIVAVARRPARDVVAGGAGRLLEIGQRVSPAMVDRWMLGSERLFETGRASQQGRQGAHRTSYYTKIFGTHPNLGRLATGLALLGAAVAVRRVGRRGVRGGSV